MPKYDSIGSIAQCDYAETVSLLRYVLTILEIDESCMLSIHYGSRKPSDSISANDFASKLAVELIDYCRKLTK